MIWLWLILLAAAYVVVAIVVGKVCAINSRWEKTVDHIDPNGEDLERGKRKRLPRRFSDGTTRLLAVGGVETVPYAGGPVEGVGD
ncbi:MAG: hypothetical protein ABIK65_10790 [Candidatus Eisenbacteria bacterium]